MNTTSKFEYYTSVFASNIEEHMMEPFQGRTLSLVNKSFKENGMLSHLRERDEKRSPNETKDILKKVSFLFFPLFLAQKEADTRFLKSCELQGFALTNHMMVYLFLHLVR